MTDSRQSEKDPIFSSDTRRFATLVEIMRRLRAPDGCPWDRQQTLTTIRDYFTEEFHEALSAIAANDYAAMREEFGDVLFEIVFLSQIASERNLFDIHDCIDSICKKLIHRHPHVFSDLAIDSPDDVRVNWEALKRKEKKALSTVDSTSLVSCLSGIPSSLPPLLQALRISERAVARGFEWPDVDGVMIKLDEEIGELREALSSGNPDAIEDELGDVLFTVVNVARKCNLTGHDALLRTISRFRARFSHMERSFERDGIEMESRTIEELEQAWQKAKKTVDNEPDHS